MWFIGVEVEQETSAPPPEKNPGSAPETIEIYLARKTLHDSLIHARTDKRSIECKRSLRVKKAEVQ